MSVTRQWKKELITSVFYVDLNVLCYDSDKYLMTKHLVTCSKSSVDINSALQDFPRGTAIWHFASPNTLPAHFIDTHTHTHTHTHTSPNSTEVPVPSHTQRCCTDTVPFTQITDYYSFLFSGHYLTSCPISKEQGHFDNQ